MCGRYQGNADDDLQMSWNKCYEINKINEKCEKINERNMIK